MNSSISLIDGYKKIEGRYPSYQDYLIKFHCAKCDYSWHIDESDVEMTELDELSHIDDVIEDSIKECPLCGTTKITRL